LQQSSDDLVKRNVMQSPPRGTRLKSSARTSIGQVRENNEDNVNLWAQDDSVLAIVADGMGGAAGGEEASRLAVEAIQNELISSDQTGLQAFQSLSEDNIAQAMREIIRHANSNIVSRAASDPNLRGMGTTVTLAFVRDMQAIVAHVGDSRAYLVSARDHSITQITADHSFVEALVAAGHITQEQAEDHPMKNVLYRALGQTDDVDVDVYHTRMRPGDLLVLCSDGLTRHVKSAEIAEIALGANDPETVSQRLIDLANERGGEDNVSVVVVRVEPEEEAHSTAPPSGIEDDTLVLNAPLSSLLNLSQADTREQPPDIDKTDSDDKKPRPKRSR
jgi:protein phosphatase